MGDTLATILVRHGVNTDGWSDTGPDGCGQTLLHRAIDENREDVACFLIRAGCDFNSPRRPGPHGRGGDEAHDMATPLHLCCQFGLAQVGNKQSLVRENFHKKGVLAIVIYSSSS